MTDYNTAEKGALQLNLDEYLKQWKCVYTDMVVRLFVQMRTINM